MTQKIANAALIIKMLRDAGYKSTSYAVAELVDNSIEALAKTVDIMLFEKDITRVRTVTQVHEIAILDDGKGMQPSVLEKCLSFGWGTRLEGATGLGKFGFGLKGASISQARRIEVYSWLDLGSVHMTYLDYDEIRESQLDDLPEVKSTTVPSKVVKALAQNGRDLPESGTLVLWKNIDGLSHKRSDTLINHLEKDMCRIFRHFLDDNDDYGKHRDIFVHVVETSGHVKKPQLLTANDPIYLLKPNNLPGYKNEATNDLNDEAILTVKDPDGVERNIKIISTIARPEIQGLGGNSAVGRHYANNNGISFVRAGRELELSIKGFFNNSEPRFRWSGIEIRFDPQLDEYFGVPNNKQGVRGFRSFDDTEIDAFVSDVENLEGSEHSAAYMKLELHKILKRMIAANEGVVKTRGASKSDPKTNGGTTSAKATKVLSVTDKDIATKSSIIAGSKSEDEKINELVELIQETDTGITLEDAQLMAQQTLKNVVNIAEGEWPGDVFLDVEFKGGGAVGKVNRRHPFFTHFYDSLRNSGDKHGFQALQVLLLALVRTEDVLGDQLPDGTFDKLRTKWGEYIKNFDDILQK